MDVEKYIASGILELYVAGLLSPEQNLEVYRNAGEYPEIRKEIEAIESAVLKLSETAYNRSEAADFHSLAKRLNKSEPPVVTLPRRESNWVSYAGWAAALVLAAGLWWVYQQNTELQSEVELSNKETRVLEQEIFEAREALTQTDSLLNTLRDRNITVIPLGGQDVSPNSYAKVYWNRQERKVFIDAQGLPEPPPGMVYQVWSLKLSPLTPTSLGLLESFESDDNKIFALNNPNDSEAFGITLEPAGGSESPTMEQLYTLGAVSES